MGSAVTAGLAWDAPKGQSQELSFRGSSSKQQRAFSLRSRNTLPRLLRDRTVPSLQRSTADNIILTASTALLTPIPYPMHCTLTR